KALETASTAQDRALIVAALARMGAAGAKEASRIYGDESQTAEARADAALVLAELGGQAEAVSALVDGAGKGPPAVREATMAALAHVYDAAGGAIERALVEATDEARAGDLARAIGLAAHGSARPEATAALSTAWEKHKGGGFALKLRLVRAMGDVGDTKLAGALAEAAKDPAAEVRAPAATELGVHALVGDAWPMVRRTAAEALAGACRQHREVYEPLRRAVTGDGKSMAGADPSEEVRRAALSAMDHC